MDAFYAAVEERLRPELRGRPIVVGADPKGGAGRGVVTAASYAARTYGIRSALPISRAWRLAETARRRGEPEVVFVRDNRAAYREVSRRIMALIADGVDAFEEASIDEAYVDLSSLGDLPQAVGHGRALKARILEREADEFAPSLDRGPVVELVTHDRSSVELVSKFRPRFFMQKRAYEQGGRGGKEGAPSPLPAPCISPNEQGASPLCIPPGATAVVF